MVFICDIIATMFGFGWSGYTAYSFNLTVNLKEVLNKKKNKNKVTLFENDLDAN